MNTQQPEVRAHHGRRRPRWTWRKCPKCLGRGWQWTWCIPWWCQHCHGHGKIKVVHDYTKP